MNADLADSCLPLAATVQSCQWVHRSATASDAPMPGMGTLVSSIFSLEADDLGQCYGGDLAALRPGLQFLSEQLGGKVRDLSVVRYALGVMQLERKLVKNRAVMARLGALIEQSREAFDLYGAEHANTYARLAEVYSQTIGTLGSRIMVTGDVQTLQQSAVVNRIRTLLLAAMRSAVLWRQLGGRRWHLLLRRKLIVRQANAWQTAIR